ncbi:MAG: Gfo/Idh/MocA family oxidoreductase [Gammaproteobacteria bacterium]|nr:Gfo/Idh/MocA family oxidoreductase [Gammaproteobacteria bacterium]
MTLRVAMLSRWHVHANEYCATINRNPAAEVVSVWDEQTDRGAAWAAELDVPFESDYESLLSREDVDAVCVVTPTNLHRDIMVGAAEARKHIFTEKVLTTTITEARDVASAIEKNDVTFCISFPRRCLPELKYAKQAIEDGLVGKPTLTRIRIAHAGSSRDWLPEHFYDLEACGGGAMMDLGAHGMYLARWLLGKPRRVISVFSNITEREVEDNAVSVIEFENGEIGINETSFVAYPDSYSLELDGTEGGVRMLSPKEGVEVRSDHLDKNGWHKVEELPDRSVSPIDQWISGCLEGSEIEFGIDEAVQLTELMDAAYRSHISGASVSIETV